MASRNVQATALLLQVIVWFIIIVLVFDLSFGLHRMVNIVSELKTAEDMLSVNRLPAAEQWERGLRFYHSDEKDLGVSLLKAAVRSAPSVPQYTADLAASYIAVGECPAALKTLMSFFNSASSAQRGARSSRLLYHSLAYCLRKLGHIRLARSAQAEYFGTVQNFEKAAGTTVAAALAADESLQSLLRPPQSSDPSRGKPFDVDEASHYSDGYGI